MRQEKLRKITPRKHLEVYSDRNFKIFPYYKYKTGRFWTQKSEGEQIYRSYAIQNWILESQKQYIM